MKEAPECSWREGHETRYEEPSRETSATKLKIQRP